jgi:hypothetical protein
VTRRALSVAEQNGSTLGTRALYCCKGVALRPAVATALAALNSAANRISGAAAAAAGSSRQQQAPRSRQQQHIQISKGARSEPAAQESGSTSLTTYRESSETAGSAGSKRRSGGQGSGFKNRQHYGQKLAENNAAAAKQAAAPAPPHILTARERRILQAASGAAAGQGKPRSEPSKRHVPLNPAPCGQSCTSQHQENLLISMWTRGGDATARQMVRISRKRIAACSHPRAPYCTGLPRKRAARPRARILTCRNATLVQYVSGWY